MSNYAKYYILDAKINIKISTIKFQIASTLDTPIIQYTYHTRINLVA